MTDEQARSLFDALLAELRDRNLAATIQEIEQRVAEGAEEETTRAEGRSTVRVVRRRRANWTERLQIALRFLHERLVVAPSIAVATRTRLGVAAVEFLPDTNLVERDEDRLVQTGKLSDLQPEAYAELPALFQPLLEPMHDAAATHIEEAS